MSHFMHRICQMHSSKSLPIIKIPTHRKFSHKNKSQFTNYKLIIQYLASSPRRMQISNKRQRTQKRRRKRKIVHAFTGRAKSAYPLELLNAIARASRNENRRLRYVKISRRHRAWLVYANFRVYNSRRRLQRCREGSSRESVMPKAEFCCFSTDATL